jgi:Raf kinase inhibitor-like YbhB/YbcL family protein
MNIVSRLYAPPKITAVNERNLTNTVDLNRDNTHTFHGEFPSSHLQLARLRAGFDRLKLFQRMECDMKSWIAALVLVSAAATTMAQTPSASVPTKPRLTLTTDAFEDGGVIPNKFTMAAEGNPVSPKLTWTYVPDGTVSFALILHDPDTSLMKKTDEVLHWLIFNIPGTARELPEGVTAQPQLPDGSIQGLNQGKKVGYMGMGAAAVGPYHHYTFELFALDTKLTVGPEATQSDVWKAMDGHILMKGVLVGRFHRP